MPDIQVELLNNYSNETTQTTNNNTPVVNDVKLLNTTHREVISQAPQENVFGRVFDNVRSFFGINQEKRNDYIDLFAIEKYGDSSAKNVNKVFRDLNDVGFSSAKPSYMAHGIADNLFDGLTMGLIKPAHTETLNLGQGFADGLAGFAGMIMGYKTLGGIGSLAAKLFTNDYFIGAEAVKNMASKLNFLDKLNGATGAITNAVVKAGTGFGIYSFIQSFTSHINEYDDTTYKPYIEAAKSGAIGKLYGSTFELIPEIFNNTLARGIAGLIAINTITKFTQGKASTLDISNAIANNQPDRLANDVLDTLMGLFAMASAKKDLEQRSKLTSEEQSTLNDINESLNKVENIIGEPINTDTIEEAVSDVGDRSIPKAEDIPIFNPLTDGEAIKKDAESLKTETQREVNTVDAVEKVKPSVAEEAETKVEADNEGITNYSSIAVKGKLIDILNKRISEMSEEQKEAEVEKTMLETTRTPEDVADEALAKTDSKVAKEVKEDVDDAKKLASEDAEESSNSQNKVYKGEEPTEQDMMYGGLPIEGFKKALGETVEGRENDINMSEALLRTPYQFILSKVPKAKKIFDAVYNKIFDVTGEHNLRNKYLNETYLEPIQDLLGNVGVKMDEATKNRVELFNTVADILGIRGDIDLRTKKGKSTLGNLLNQHSEKLGLTAEDIKRVKKAIYLQKELGDELLKDINTYTKKKLEALVDNMKAKGFSDSYIKKVEEVYSEVILPQVSGIKFYVHRDRGLGNVAIIGRDSDGRVWFREHTTDVLNVLTGGKKVSYAVSQRIKELQKEYPNYTFEVNNVEKLDLNKVDAMDIVDFLYDAMEEEGISHFDMEGVINKIYTKLKAEGFMATAIHRSVRHIEGYEKDVLTATQSYLSKMQGFFLKQNLKTLLEKLEMEHQIRKDTNLGKVFFALKDELLRNKDAVDTLVGKTRGLMYVKYLAGIVRPVLINLLQTPIITASMLIEEFGEHNIAKVHTVTTGSAVDAAKFLLNPDDKSIFKNEREYEVVKQLYDEGHFSAQETAFVSGKADLKNRLTRQVMSILSFGFSKSESINRIASALSYMRMMGEKDLSNLSLAEIKMKVRAFTYMSNGVYGYGNMPFFMLGKGSMKQLLKAGYTFKSYNQQMLQNLLHMMGKDKVAFAHALGMLMVFGGITAAMPFFNLLNFAYNKATDGGDLKLDISNKIYEWTHSRALRDFTYGGASKLLGLDLTNSLMLTTPLDDVAYTSDLGDYILSMVGGVYWATLKDTAKGIDNLKHGNVEKAFEYGIPLKFITYPMKAIHDYKMGLTTKGNLSIVDPMTNEPIKPNIAEGMLEAFGFTPAKVSEYKYDLNAFKTQVNYFKSIKEKLNGQFREALLQRDWKKVNVLVKKMNNLNRKIASDGLIGIVPLMNPKRIKTLKINKSILNYFMKHNLNLGD